MKSILLLLTALISQNALADEHAQFTQQSKAAIKEFATALKGSLVTAMKSGGPTEAITVCNQVAPSISAQLSEKYGFTIARTSSKVRNPENAADAWEKDVLSQFESRKDHGEEIKTLMVSEEITRGGIQELRVMKAIPTGEVCLKCHGSNIAEPVKASLKKLYPDDEATGFALGDIRGAFTVQKIINQ